MIQIWLINLKFAELKYIIIYSKHNFINKLRNDH